MVLRRKFRGFSRKETSASRAFKKENARLTLLDMVRDGDIRGLKRLLGKDGINLEETNDMDETALILAAMAGDLEALQLLIDAGALIDATSSLNTTALMAAAQNGDLRAMQYLLSKGANPNSKKKDDTTILMMAAMLGHVEGIYALLEAGAFLTVEDVYGYTALMLAGNEECASILSAAEAREKGMHGKHAPAGKNKTHGKKLKKALSHAGKKRGKSHARPKKEKHAHEKHASVHTH